MNTDKVCPPMSMVKCLLTLNFLQQQWLMLCGGCRVGTTAITTCTPSTWRLCDRTTCACSRLGLVHPLLSSCTACCEAW